MPFVDKIYLTEIELEVEGDVFFPELDPDLWIVESEEHHEPDEKNEFAFTIRVFQRRKT